MQKEINFTLDAKLGKFVASTSVNADYNVRVEREHGGSIKVLQSTVQGRKPIQKDSCLSAGTEWEGEYDNLVYPKYVKIVSETPVTKAWVSETDI